MNIVAKVVAALVVVAAASSSGIARAENWQGVVTLYNPTNIPVNYSFKWGENAEWTSFTLQPGQSYCHSWPYSYADEDMSPVPYIRFDNDLSAGFYPHLERLSAYATPHDACHLGKSYHFLISGDQSLLELVG